MEKFHQSFFFYLLPSSNHYVSIGMYMPAFGLICLPILVKTLTLWFTIFFRTNEDQKNVIFERKKYQSFSDEPLL